MEPNNSVKTYQSPIQSISSLKSISPFLILILFLVGTTISLSAQTSVWGMTAFGGSAGYGTIYKTDNNGQNQELVHQWQSVGSDMVESDPRLPGYGLVDGKDGFLYGSTLYGGPQNNGVFFRINATNNTYEELFDLSFLSEFPGFGFTIDYTTRTIYGSVSYGGESGLGSLFSLNMTSGEYEEIHAWTYDLIGHKPEGNPVLHNGKLYGITLYGGAHDGGVLFEYDIINDQFRVLRDFDAESSGISPFFQFEIVDNVIYGTTRAGGASNMGTLYTYDLNSNVFDIKHTFSGEDGEGGRSIAKASNTLLIGNTIRGGFHGKGTLFTYNIASNSFTKKIDFNGSNNGANPETSLLSIGNNEYLGTTRGGGDNGTGVNYTYNLDSNSVTLNFSFNGVNGAHPGFNSLISVENVDDALVIIRQPDNIATCVGQSIQLEVEASPNPESLTYQWYKDQNQINGANNAILIIENATEEDAGSFHCVVSRGDEQVVSNIAMVELTEAIHVEWEEETCNPFNVGQETITYSAQNGCDSIVTVHRVAAYVDASYDIDIQEGMATFDNNSENATHYFWSFGDGVTSTEAEPVHEYQSTGFYMVLLVAMKDGCLPDFQLRFVFVFNGLRTSELAGLETMDSFQEIARKIANPTPGPVKLNNEITFSSDKIMDLTVIDSKGRKVQSELINSINHKFDLSYLTSDTYVFKVEVDGQSYEQNIVVSH